MGWLKEKLDSYTNPSANSTKLINIFGPGENGFEEAEGEVQERNELNNGTSEIQNTPLNAWFDRATVNDNSFLQKVNKLTVSKVIGMPENQVLSRLEGEFRLRAEQLGLKGLDFKNEVAELPQGNVFTIVGNQGINPMSASRKAALPMQFNVLFDQRVFGGTILTPNVPPLVLLINPSELKRSFVKKLFPDLTRGGWVTERWGEELTQISATGSSGAFYFKETSGTESNFGLTRVNRNDTKNYQEFIKLYNIFINNGQTNISELINKESAKGLDVDRIFTVGSVAISYGNERLIGTFESFTIDEDADNPYQVKYSFEFKVEESEELADNSLTGDQIRGPKDFNEKFTSTTLGRVMQQNDSETLLRILGANN